MKFMLGVDALGSSSEKDVLRRLDLHQRRYVTRPKVKDHMFMLSMISDLPGYIIGLACCPCCLGSGSLNIGG